MRKEMFLFLLAMSVSFGCVAENSPCGNQGCYEWKHFTFNPENPNYAPTKIRFSYDADGNSREVRYRKGDQTFKGEEITLPNGNKLTKNMDSKDEVHNALKDNFEGKFKTIETDGHPFCDGDGFCYNIYVWGKEYKMP